MENIKVSVIVPVYNVEKYLRRCLDSLVNQTLKEIEIIVVNDGTKDNSQDIIDEYKKKYKTIRSFIKENGGLSSARNYGVEYAKGEYLAFVDSDDFVDTDMYEKMYNEATKRNLDVVVSPYYYLFNTKEITYKMNSEVFNKNAFSSPKIYEEAKSFAWNKIYKTSFYKNHKFTFPNQWFEDSAIMYEILSLANKVGIVNIPFYHYRKQRDGAITNTVNTKIFDVFKSCDQILSFFKKQNKYDELKEYVDRLCLGHVIYRLAVFKDNHDWSMFKQFVNEAKQYFDKNIKNWKNNSYLNLQEVTNKQARNRLIYFKYPYLFFLTHTFLLRVIKKIFTKTISFVKKAIKKVIKKIINHEEKVKKQKRKYIQENGYEVLSDISKITKEIGIVCFADFGTMLGLVREQKLLSHDLDMDMGIIDNNNLGIDRITTELKRRGFVLWRQYIYNDKVVEQSYYYKNIRVDFNYYETTKDNAVTYLFYKEPHKKYKSNERNIVKMTYSKIDSLKEIKIKGKKINIPENAEKLLEEKYGPSWKIPDKGWIYWQSPAATKLEDIGIFITSK